MSEALRKTGRYRYGSYSHKTILENVPSHNLAAVWDVVRLRYAETEDSLCTRIEVEEEWAAPQPKVALPGAVSKTISEYLGTLEAGALPYTVWVRAISSFGTSYTLDGQPSGIKFVALNVAPDRYNTAATIWGTGPEKLAQELEGIDRNSLKFKSFPSFPMVEGRVYDTLKIRFLRITALRQDWEALGITVP